MSDKRFVVDELWVRRLEAAAPGMGGDVADVALDKANRVYLLTRYPAGVFIFEADGSFIHSWGGTDLSARPHGITLGMDGMV